MNKLLTVVVLNDTRFEYHHGCSRVMNAIDYYLKEKTQEITYFPVGKNWQKNESIKQKIITADLVIVNGEGTIHHNSVLGLSLVKVARFAASYGVKSFLINSTYQENAETYKKYLSYFDKIFVRESYSQKELSELGIESAIVPDLTFSFVPNHSETKGSERILITCSVNKDVTDSLLATFEHNQGATFSSIFNDNEVEEVQRAVSLFHRVSQILKNNSLNAIVNKLFNKISNFDNNSQVEWFTQNTHTDYSDYLESAKLVVCGRFHAMTMCINHKVPFLAIESNSHKVSGTLADIGLDREKYLVKADQITWGQLQSFDISEEDQDKMLKYSTQAKASIADMFNEILK